MKHEIQFVEICYQFTQEELNALGPIIARLSQDWQEKEDEKKAVMSDFKHQIDAIKKEFNENCNRLNNKFEMRSIRARKIKNYRTGEFEFYSMDTFEKVKTEPFRSGDYQRDFDDIEDEKPYGAATEPTPEPAGTAETNPAQYSYLLHELTYWREQLASITTWADEDQEIDKGLEIGEKIKAIEATLKAMEPEAEAGDDADNTDKGEGESDTI